MPHLLQLVSKNLPVDEQRQSPITRTFLFVCYIDSPATPSACGFYGINIVGLCISLRSHWCLITVCDVEFFVQFPGDMHSTWSWTRTAANSNCFRLQAEVSNAESKNETKYGRPGMMIFNPRPGVITITSHW